MNNKFKLFRFSPIKTKENLFDAINYVSKEMGNLCKKITGTEYPIACLTIFSHYPGEFENLKEIAFSLGNLDSEANGPYVKLTNPIQLKSNKLDLLRIRNPDPYRYQVGCGDFEVPDYKEFKKTFLIKKSDNLRLISRPEYDMIEFFDPDFDVLAYVLSKEI